MHHMIIIKKEEEFDSKLLSYRLLNFNYSSSDMIEKLTAKSYLFTINEWVSRLNHVSHH